MDGASIALLAVSACALLLGWIWALRGLARAVAFDACPVCRGYGTLRAGRATIVRCRDCGGEGAAAELVPNFVPAAWSRDHGSY